MKKTNALQSPYAVTKFFAGKKRHFRGIRAERICLCRHNTVRTGKAVITESKWDKELQKQ